MRFYCTIALPLFLFFARYQSLNLTHVPERSVGVYEFRWRHQTRTRRDADVLDYRIYVMIQWNIQWEACLTGVKLSKKYGTFVSSCIQRPLDSVEELLLMWRPTRSRYECVLQLCV